MPIASTNIQVLFLRYGPSGSVYKKKGSAMFDYDTRNVSFIKVTQDLKALSVVDYELPLTLLDERLLGVDPHTINDYNDPGNRYRTWITRECARNPWYFAREVVRVDIPGKPPGQYLQASMPLVAALWAQTKKSILLMIAPRQSGRGCAVNTVALWASMFPLMADIPVSMAPNYRLKDHNVSQVKMLKNQLPPYLKGMAVPLTYKFQDKSPEVNLKTAEAPAVHTDCTAYTDLSSVLRRACQCAITEHEADIYRPYLFEGTRPPEGTDNRKLVDELLINLDVAFDWTLQPNPGLMVINITGEMVFTPEDLDRRKHSLKQSDASFADDFNLRTL